MKVYIVEAGESYECGSIRGIFASKAEAEAYRDRLYEEAKLSKRISEADNALYSFLRLKHPEIPDEKRWCINYDEILSRLPQPSEEAYYDWVVVTEKDVIIDGD